VQLDKIHVRMKTIDKNKPYAVMSGIKPDGSFHLGNKMTADDMVYFQSLSKKAEVFYAIATSKHMPTTDCPSERPRKSPSGIYEGIPTKS
jgi:tryptophanyl-tRNA synthetase